ncbi:MAG: hypothetical protein GX307_08545, partial [Euryarchaeota archaeon]|nr:hypothetical protein [Euryarchaeota archaeon]
MEEGKVGLIERLRRFFRRGSADNAQKSTTPANTASTEATPKTVPPEAAPPKKDMTATTAKTAEPEKPVAEAPTVSEVEEELPAPAIVEPPLPPAEMLQEQACFLCYNAWLANQITVREEKKDDAIHLIASPLKAAPFIMAAFAIKKDKMPTDVVDLRIVDPPLPPAAMIQEQACFLCSDVWLANKIRVEEKAQDGGIRLLASPAEAAPYIRAAYETKKDALPSIVGISMAAPQLPPLPPAEMIQEQACFLCSDVWLANQIRVEADVRNGVTHLVASPIAAAPYVRAAYDIRKDELPADVVDLSIVDP